MHVGWTVVGGGGVGYVGRMASYVKPEMICQSCELEHDVPWRDVFEEYLCDGCYAISISYVQYAPVSDVEQSDTHQPDTT